MSVCVYLCMCLPVHILTPTRAFGQLAEFELETELEKNTQDWNKIHGPQFNSSNKYTLNTFLFKDHITVALASRTFPGWDHLPESGMGLVWPSKGLQPGGDIWFTSAASGPDRQDGSRPRCRCGNIAAHSWGGGAVNELCLFILYIACEWSVWTAFFVREEGVPSNHALVSAVCPCFRPPLKLLPLAVIFRKKEGFCSLTSTSTDGASLCFENYDSCQRSPLTHKVGL